MRAACLSALSGALLLTACSHTAQNTTEAASPPPTSPPATATTQPSLPPPPGTGNTAQPTSAATPGATNAPRANATVTAAAAAPAILSVSVSPSTVHEGDTVSWQARTTADVTSVEAHVRVATLPFQRQAPGNFTMGFTIPQSVPPIFHGSYSVDVVGHTAAGATVSRSVSIDFR